MTFRTAGQYMSIVVLREKKGLLRRKLSDAAFHGTCFDIITGRPFESCERLAVHYRPRPMTATFERD